MFSVHTTPEKFELATITCGRKAQDVIVFKNLCFQNGFGHAETPSHTTLEEFTNAIITGHFGLFLRKTGSGKSHDYRDVIVFEKLRFQNVFPPHGNENPVFLNSSRLKSVFEKLRFQNVFLHTETKTRCF